MVHIPCPICSLHLNAFLQKIFMDIEQATAGENFVELVFQQLVHAGSARHNHCLDVEIVQRVRDTMEQHAIVGGDLVGLVCLP